LQTALHQVSPLLGHLPVMTVTFVWLGCPFLLFLLIPIPKKPF
jgi:hypothetical protein